MCDAEEVAEGSILWRVNNDEFNRVFRHQACVDMVTAKINVDAGYVLRCMLDVTRSSETKASVAIEAPASRVSSHGLTMSQYLSVYQGQQRGGGDVSVLAAKGM